MNFPASIFKAYDIRGLVEGELSPELAYRVGRAFAITLRETYHETCKDKSIVVGYDMRPTSVGFKEAVIVGIQDEGVDVVDVGLTSTPLFYFACTNYSNHAGGIMVTASHNPGQYNGFKLTLGSGLPIGKDTGMDKIKNVVQQGDFKTPIKKGVCSKKSVVDEYIATLYNLVSPEAIKPFTIVIDAGNGMGKVTFPHVLKKIPVEVEYLYLEPDGTFPNHEANPLKTETLKELQKKVVQINADFGLALDGDCDRIGLVDEKGEVVDPSFVGALIGGEVLRDHGGGSMLYDLRSSMVVQETWESLGAVTTMCKVGHAFIKKQMKETSSVIFASELSEHFYYHDLHDVESSDLSLLYILKLLSREQKPLSELLVPLKKYFHSGEINFTVAEKEKVIQKIKDTYSVQAKEVVTLDGLWMKFDWGWFNVRASNTEPVLRLNVEAYTNEQMVDEVQKLKELCL